MTQEVAKELKAAAEQVRELNKLFIIMRAGFPFTKEFDGVHKYMKSADESMSCLTYWIENAAEQLEKIKEDKTEEVSA
jgi:hypothetical protein